MVTSATKGRGVDLVLNSLTGSKLLASARCLGRNGRFLELGKLDLWNNNSLPVDFLGRGAAFIGVFVDEILLVPGFRKELHGMLSRGMREGYVRPLPREVFPKEGLEEALRYMGSGRHIGKVLVRVLKSEQGGKSKGSFR